jgi:hypothetical protein
LGSRAAGGAPGAAEVIGIIGSFISIVGATYWLYRWISRFWSEARYAFGIGMTEQYLNQLTNTVKKYRGLANRPNRLYAQILLRLADICGSTALMIAIMSLVDDWYLRNGLMLWPFASAVYSTTVIFIDLQLVLKPLQFFDTGIKNLKSHLAHFTPRGDQDRDYVEVVKELLALYENERDRVAQHIQEGE